MHCNSNFCCLSPIIFVCVPSRCWGHADIVLFGDMLALCTCAGSTKARIVFQAAIMIRITLVERTQHFGCPEYAADVQRLCATSRYKAVLFVLIQSCKLVLEEILSSLSWSKPTSSTGARPALADQSLSEFLCCLKFLSILFSPSGNATPNSAVPLWPFCFGASAKCGAHRTQKCRAARARERFIVEAARFLRYSFL